MIFYFFPWINIKHCIKWQLKSIFVFRWIFTSLRNTSNDQKLQQTIWETPDVTRIQTHKHLKGSFMNSSKHQWKKQSDTKQNFKIQDRHIKLQYILFSTSSQYLFNNTPSFNCIIILSLQNSSYFLCFYQFLHLKCFPVLFWQITFHLLRLNLLCEVALDYSYLSPDKEVSLSL